jgi:hypothetical protein
VEQEEIISFSTAGKRSAESEQAGRASRWNSHSKQKNVCIQGEREFI